MENNFLIETSDKQRHHHNYRIVHRIPFDERHVWKVIFILRERPVYYWIPCKSKKKWQQARADQTDPYCLDVELFKTEEQIGEGFVKQKLKDQRDRYQDNDRIDKHHTEKVWKEKTETDRKNWNGDLFEIVRDQGLLSL